jgi:DNA-binding transcriptional MerR regulator
MAGEGEQPVYSIGAVARMLGVPTSTLRAWEDRYSLITPIRSEGSQRLYSRSQVDQLRFIKAQIDSGVSAADAHRLLSEEIRSGNAAPAAPEPGAGPRPLVLVAERDPYAAELAEYFLRNEGWDVIIALDPEVAMQQFNERSPDVALVDMLIPGGDGFRLLREFAAQHKAKVIAISAINSADEAMRLGAERFVLKPIEPRALVAMVGELLEAGGSGARVLR